MDRRAVQKAEIIWRDGSVPVSRHFDDPYFSMQGGLAETNHVFLHGNDLPDRFCDRFQIAELGFGTGLNVLAAWDLWRRSGIAGQLKVTSFEAFPLQTSDLAKALQTWPELSGLSNTLISMWESGKFVHESDEIVLEIIIGDARDTLPNWQGEADAWFLDGFSPAKNPEMWSPELMQQVAAHTHQNGTFATYTAAGHVRRALASAGFQVERVPGFGAKKHMTRGIKL